MDFKRYKTPYEKAYTDIANDKENIYLFTDNLLRTSGNASLPKEADKYKKRFSDVKNKKRPLRGNAIIRGLDNAYPITLMKDSRSTEFTDSNFDEAKKIIDEDFEHIKNACIEKNPKHVYLPFNGLFYKDTNLIGKFKLIRYIIQKEKEIITYYENNR